MMDKKDSLGLISVIIPSYNAEKTIEKAIQSVIVQTYSNIEVIIVDDCSKDGTVKTAISYAAKDNRIKVLQNQTNMGVALTRNKGVKRHKEIGSLFLIVMTGGFHQSLKSSQIS